MAERILSTRPRVIPNWQMPEPSSTPMSAQDQAVLAESAILSGSDTSEASIVSILQAFSYQTYETDLNNASSLNGATSYGVSM